MTEKRRRPAALPTVLLALALFGIAFEFLAFQLKAGKDPALGDTTATAAPAAVKPRKKIIVTRVLPARGGNGSLTSSSTPLTSAPAPVSTSSS